MATSAEELELRGPEQACDLVERRQLRAQLRKRLLVAPGNRVIQRLEQWRDTRPLCLPGLEERYGLSFGQVIPLDAAGDYTVSSLAAGTIDVGLLFSTDGRIPANGFVVLADDRDLQPAENVTPLVRRPTVDALGAAFVSILDQVSAELTTQDLTLMNEQVTVDHQPAYAVASHWLREHGLGH